MAVNKASRNERIKLLANTLNTIGLAFLVPGVVVPLVTLLYGADPPRSAFWLAIAIWWAAQAVILHAGARAVLGGIEE